MTEPDAAPGAAPPPGAPVRFTVVLDELSVGGVEVLLLHLFRAFDPAAVLPSVICLRQAGPLAAEFRSAGFEVGSLGRTGRFDRRTLPRLVRELRARRTDVVLVTHHQRAALALGRLAAKLARVRANVVAAHDMDLVPVGGRVLPAWAVRTLAISDALVLLSEGQGRYLREQEGVGRWPWARVRQVVIRNGIPLRPAPDPQQRARARALLGVGPEDVVVGVVARLSAQKAHEVLFAAVAESLPGTPSLRVVLVGDGDRREALHAEAERLGIGPRVSFLGTRRDVPDLLPGFDVSCLSSVHEGVPVALIEAMAAGVPVVATDCGSVADLVTDEVTGYVVPVGDTTALGDRLRRLADDPTLRARLGQASRRRAERDFGIEHTAQGYQNLLCELVAAR